MLDDLFSSTDTNTDVDLGPYMASSFAVDPTGLIMDHDISDSELDEPAAPSEDGLSSDQDLDSDDDSETEPHPAMEPNPDNGDADGSLSEREPDSVDFDEEDLEEDFAASSPDLPEVVKWLWEQLESGYTCPNHPPINDLRNHSLTKAEKLS